MISLEESFPKRSNKYLLAQDVIWTQFNEVNFYVEDIEQENFYFEILSKLFPEVKFERVFPLGGKKNVIDEARRNTRRKKKVFIVDLDFDLILDKKVQLNNLFYLNKYSIENHMIEEASLVNIIKDEKPKLKNTDINARLDFENLLKEFKPLFPELICRYITIQKHDLGIPNVNIDPARFCSLNSIPANIISSNFQAYSTQIEHALKAKDKRLSLKAQVRKYLKHFSSIPKILTNVPGKYLLKFIKYRVEHIFSIPQMTLESFTYRLARNSALTKELQYLKNDIETFLKS
jgi:hypothetical protein